MNRLLVIAIALAAMIGFANASRAADPGADTLAAQQIVHLLDYVGSDYGGAVSEGRVVDEKELAEQLEVLAEAGRLAARLRPPAQRHAAFQPREAVERVKRLVEAHRPETEVAAAAKAGRTELVAFYDLVQAPRELASRERGQRLYEQHCVACHGIDGRADTPRALQLSPRPVNFHTPELARALSPQRVFSTVRFGVPNTAMVPFDFLSDAERWDVAFYVSEFDHAPPPTGSHDSARLFGLGELATESDDELRDDLRSSGIEVGALETALADLRLRAPYDPQTLQPKGASGMVQRARRGLQKASLLLRRDSDAAKTLLRNVYLDNIEPLEAPLRARDPVLTRDIEARFKELPADIDRGAPQADVDKKLEALRGELARAGHLLEEGTGSGSSFWTTLLPSAGIALREGVEAALLIAALLAIVGGAGRPERKRWVHAGWTAALAAGVATWLASRRVVEMSGVGRELLEGISALLAAAVLFYVSYWLFAKREAARWVTYLRSKASSSGAAFSLFGISFLAVYREAFETVLFYQALIAQPGSAYAAGVGAALGAALLVAGVFAYGRVVGKFVPPRSFFSLSTLLLYALAVVFAGQGISALQTTGHLPLHAVGLPNLPALGVYPTIETYLAQATFVLLAIIAGIVMRIHRSRPAARGPGSGIPSEGAKL